MAARLVGVHPVEAKEPCHLLEIELESECQQIDWGGMTQESADQPAENWQVAYDETPLNKQGTRWAFSFIF